MGDLLLAVLVAAGTVQLWDWARAAGRWMWQRLNEDVFQERP